jgi:hypothetical protein
MDDSVIFYGHLVNFPTIWYILLHFGILCGHLVCFDTFWYIVPRKIWQPCSEVESKAEKVPLK